MTKRNTGLWVSTLLVLLIVIATTRVQSGVTAETNSSDKVALAQQQTVREFYKLREIIVVELTLQYEMPAKNGILEQVTNNGMTIFEFAGDKIRRVAEY